MADIDPIGSPSQLFTIRLRIEHLDERQHEYGEAG